ncbi:MAG: hypothetical protein NT096_15335 [Proteobacteria bacterium]|nr:hypothetical protein [Pseudomonadota bacterium]
MISKARVEREVRKMAMYKRNEDIKIMAIYKLFLRVTLNGGKGKRGRRMG